MLLPTFFSGTLFGVVFFWGSQEENHIVWGGGSLKKDMPTCSCQLYFQVPFLGLLFFGEASCQLYFQVPFLGLLFFGEAKRKTTLFGGVPKEGHAHVLLPTLFSGTFFGVGLF